MSHPRPPDLWQDGCTVGVATRVMLLPGRVVEHQSASSCRAGRCVVVRRTRRVVSVESPVLTFVGFSVAPLLDRVTAVALSIFGRTSHHSWLISLAVTADLHSTCRLDLLLTSPHCVRYTADWIDLRNVRSPPGLLALAAVAARLLWRQLLRPARGVFVALQLAITDHRELQQRLLKDLAVDTLVRQLFLLCKIADSSVFSFHSSSCCLPCCIPQSTRVLRSRLGQALSFRFG